MIHTDQGSNFNSELMQDFYRIFMIEKTRTTPYHPERNGQVERFNRVIADTLSKYCAEKPQEWDVYLPCIFLCIIPPFTELLERRRTP